MEKLSNVFLTFKVRMDRDELINVNWRDKYLNSLYYRLTLLSTYLSRQKNLELFSVYFWE